MEPTDRLALRPEEAARALGIGRSTVYALLAAGELPRIRIGNSVRVPVVRLREWVNRKADELVAATSR